MKLFRALVGFAKPETGNGVNSIDGLLVRKEEENERDRERE